MPFCSWRFPETVRYALAFAFNLHEILLCVYSPFANAEFDAAFEVEATCHSPNRVECFSQVFRCLKPGGLFAGYEWVVTDNYDPKNVDHVRWKEGIEVGNGLPTLATAEEVLENLREAGFEIVDAFDPHEGTHDENRVPWYSTLEGE